VANPRRVGSLERDEPISPVSKTLEGRPFGRFVAWTGNPMRGGAVKAAAIPVRVNTLEGRSPRELRARVGLNRRSAVADSRVEQSPEVEGRFRGLAHMGTAGLWRDASAFATGSVVLG